MINTKVIGGHHTVRRIVASAVLAAGVLTLAACGGSETNESAYSLDTLRSKTSE